MNKYIKKTLNFVKKYFNNESFRYFINRLLPFYVVGIIIEIISSFVLGVEESKNIDFSFFVMLKTILSAVLETTTSFLYTGIFIIIYLLSLPKKYTYKKFDKVFSLVLFFVYIFQITFEEVAEHAFWEEFSATFNFIAIDYLVYTKEVIGNIIESYPMFTIIGSIFVFSSTITFLFRKKIFNSNITIPNFKTKLLYFALYLLLCSLLYINLDIKNSQISQNRYNNELAKEGTYSLFSAFLKNELNYNNFYVTSSDSENLTLLKKELNTSNTKFLDNSSIRRHITSKKHEIKANVVVVVMESMGREFFSDLRKDGKILTPSLENLAKNGIYFPNTYASGTRSVRGLEAISVSIPPLPGTSIVRMDGNDNLQTIDSIFRDKGYSTQWIYGGYGYFDNMNDFYFKNGFSVMDRTNFAKSEITTANIWGVADEDLFRKTIDEADKSYMDNKPFLKVVFTTSNHRPFTYPEGRIDIASKTGRSGAVKYADYAVGEFIKQAKEKPWFNNTLFVFVADHGAGSAGKKELNPEAHLIPLIFYAPKIIKHEEYTKPIAQIDTLPTLLGILNFSYDASFYGKDARLPSYKSRYFLSNYQYLGYVRDNKMVILKPVKEVSYYEDNTLTNKEFKNNLDEAVSYYQTASEWRKNLKINK